MQTISPAKSLVEQTYDALVDAICAGEFLPGDRLNQDDIAARLNVSRQPVNSAISILKANGFAEDTGRRGAVVASLEATKLRDVFEFRAVLEPFAVRLATDRLPKAAGRQAQKILDKGHQAVTRRDVLSLVQADAAFHQMIYRWSGNHVIENSMHVNWHHIRRAMADVLQNPDLARDSWVGHDRIISAMLDHRGDDAAQEMIEHIENARIKTLTALEPASV